MKKIKEVWGKLDWAAKLFTIAAPVLFVAYLYFAISDILEIFKYADAFARLILALMWGLLSLLWRKKSKWCTIFFAGFALGNTILGILSFLG